MLKGGQAAFLGQELGALGEFGDEFHAGEARAAHDDVAVALVLGGVGAVDEVEDLVGVAELLEFRGVLGQSGDAVEVRDAAQADDQGVVREDAAVLEFDFLVVQVDGFDLRLFEVHAGAAQQRGQGQGDGGVVRGGLVEAGFEGVVGVLLDHQRFESGRGFHFRGDSKAGVTSTEDEGLHVNLL
jgi:hypothetical protein